jgi:hypothetical protein
LHRPGSVHVLSTGGGDGDDNYGDGDADDTTMMDIDDGGDGNFGDDGGGNFGDDGNCGGDDADRKRVSSWGSYSTPTDEPLQQLPRLRPATGPRH